MSPPVAFEEAFDELFAVAYRVALRLTGSASAAEDAASEALTRAYVRWGRLAGASGVEAWVVRVTTNIVLDGYRRNRRHPIPPRAPKVQEAEGDDGSLAAAMTALPRRQRQVVALRYLAEDSAGGCCSGLRSNARSGPHPLDRSCVPAD